MSQNNDLTVFNGEITFEDFANTNGFLYWWSSDLMRFLGYSDERSYSKALNKASKVFTSLDIPAYDHIIQADNNGSKDHKLTRFACYLIAMNADPSHPQVAAAQAYFAEQTRKAELLYLDQQPREPVERLVTRERIKNGQRSIASTVKQHGVTDYARFQNAGFLGLYNRLNIDLAKKRCIRKEHLYDYMGKVELAANLFRISLTEEKIKSENICGQENLERAHRSVGQSIRKQVIDNTGKNPEDLPQEPRIPVIKSQLKKLVKKMTKEDKKD